MECFGDMLVREPGAAAGGVQVIMSRVERFDLEGFGGHGFTCGRRQLYIVLRHVLYLHLNV